MKSNTTMKTILMITLAFGIQLSGLMAGNNGSVVIPTEPGSAFCPDCIVLSPTVPMEADFDEVVVPSDTASFSPVIPMTADFSEVL